MKKRILTFTLAFMMVFSLLAAMPAIAADTVTAKAASATVLVNGENKSFDAYNINGNNFFKLRDLAFVLSGSEKQFEVGWSSTSNAITLTSGKPYTPDGNEMTGKGAGDKAAASTKSKIILDGKEVNLTAYNIEGNNYFKLRDIGESFNFGVDWDGVRNTIVIDTGKGYTPEAPAAVSSAVPPGKYVHKKPEIYESGPLAAYIQINSDGSFERNVFDFSYGLCHLGTYAVTGDTVKFTILTYYDSEDNTEREYTEEIPSRYFSYKFDGVNLVALYEYGLIESGDLFVKE
jgi:hypothetical protein